MSKIVVSVCTFRRPVDLENLFGSFKGLRVTDEMDLSFRVIDNDNTPSSQGLVARLDEALPWPVDYVHEPDPGIPAARNRAIEEAGTQGYLAFVDDDETVSEDWLVELLRIARSTRASFVQGPVKPLVADIQDAWWAESIFFKHRRFEDGFARHESWTNNVMVDLAVVAKTGCRFDPALRYDGGSDTLFFQDIIRKGGTGAFAAHAWAYELQPKSRLRWTWALGRQFRYGTTRAMCALLRNPRWQASVQCTIRGAALAVVGLVILPTGLVRGRTGLANGSAYLARAAGVFWGLMGGRRAEYAR